MNELDFWAIVENTKVTDDAPASAKQLQCEKLRDILSEMPIEKIAAFDRQFVTLLRDSYSWDLWHAVWYMQGASDDGFEYFRYWLISHSNEHLSFEHYKGTINRFLHDYEPDHLGDLIPYGEPTSKNVGPNVSENEMPGLYPKIAKAIEQRRSN